MPTQANNFFGGIIIPDEIDCVWLAKSVADAMAISAIGNPRIPLAEKKFGHAVQILAKKLPLKKEKLSENEKKLVESLSEVKYGPLFYEVDGIVYYKDKVGESVIIHYVAVSLGSKKTADALRDECWRRGCHVVCIPESSAEARARYLLSPDSALFEFSKLSYALTHGANVSISIGDEENPDWSRGIEKKLAFGAKAKKARYAEYEKSKVRSARLGFPVERDGFVAREKYFSVFYATLKETFSKKMPEIVDYYDKKMRGCDKIHITANDGTDLSFSLKGRELLRDDASPPQDKSVGDHYNFPAGEVFFAPVETSAEGIIIFDYVLPSGFGLIRDLKLAFRKGKVVDFSAKGDGAERFQKFLDANTGEKDRIGELGIGCNPGADFIGTTIVDEKIFGSIHIAIGWNRGPYKGKNEASSHQDMIKIMKGKNGNMYADGVLVMKDGMPVE